MEAIEFQKLNEVQDTNWWFAAQRRLVTDYLEKNYGRSNHLRILNVACACGTYSRHMARFGKIYNIDISKEALKYCLNNGVREVVQADATLLPFKENSFDLVLAIDAFEHFPDDRQAMKEIRRVLKEGGRMLLTVPAFNFLWSPHDEALHHLRRYTATGLVPKILDSGFKVEFVSYWTMLLLPAIYIFRRIRKILSSETDTPKSDLFIALPRPLENLLGFTLGLETFLMKRNLKLPFGLSLFCSVICE